MANGDYLLQEYDSITGSWALDLSRSGRASRHELSARV